MKSVPKGVWQEASEKSESLSSFCDVLHPRREERGKRRRRRGGGGGRGGKGGGKTHICECISTLVHAL